MNKIILKNIHKMFGRVTAFVLAFIMALTLMPALTGKVEVKAETTTVTYDSDNASFSASKEYDADWQDAGDGKVKKTTTWTFSKSGSTSNENKSDKDVLGIIFNGKYGKQGFVSTKNNTLYIPVDSETTSGTLTITFDGNNNKRALLNGNSVWFVYATGASEEKAFIRDDLTKYEGELTAYKNKEYIALTNGLNTTSTTESDKGDINIASITLVEYKEAGTKYSISSGTVSNGEVSFSIDNSPVTEALKGKTVTIETTPTNGYRIENDSDVTATYGEGNTKLDLTSSGDGKYTFTMPEGAVTVNATFTAIPTHALTITDPGNSNVIKAYSDASHTSEITGTEVAEDSTVYLEATPADDYGFTGFTVTGSIQSTYDVTSDAENGYYFTMPAEAVTVSGQFSNQTYDITYADTNNGTVTEKTTPSVAGKKITLNIAPDDKYEVDTVTVTGTNAPNTTYPVDTTNGYSFTMPAEAVTVTVTFKEKAYAVTIPTPANGTVEVSGSTTTSITDGTTVKPGEKVIVTATPGNNAVFGSIKVTETDGSGEVTPSEGSAVNTYTFTMPEYPVTITVTFKSTTATTKTWTSVDGLSHGLDTTGFANACNSPSYGGAVNGSGSKGLKMSSTGVLAFKVSAGKYAKVTVKILANGEGTATLGITKDAKISDGTAALKSIDGWLKNPLNNSEELLATTTKNFSTSTAPQEITFKGYLEGGEEGTTYYLANRSLTSTQPFLYYVSVDEYDDVSYVPQDVEAAKVNVSGKITSAFDLTGATITLKGDTSVTATVAADSGNTYSYTAEGVTVNDTYTVSVASDSLTASKSYIESYSATTIAVAEEEITNADFTITYGEITNEWDFTTGKYGTKTVQTDGVTFKGLKVDASSGKFDVQSARVQVNPGTTVTVPVAGYEEGTLTLTFSNSANAVKLKFGEGEEGTTYTYTIPSDATEVTFTVTEPSNGAFLTKIALTEKSTVSGGDDNKEEEPGAGGSGGTEGGNGEEGGNAGGDNGEEGGSAGGDNAAGGTVGGDNESGGNAGGDNESGGNAGSDNESGDNAGDNGEAGDNTGSDTTDTNFGWATDEETGVKYWFEDGVKQGTENRGKEIYDPETNAWYFLDAVDGGKIATSKDVAQPTDWDAYNADPIGYDQRAAEDSSLYKWVRYDSEGKMVKGWCSGTADSSTKIDNASDAGNEATYYFDPITGEMAKGDILINNVPCYFDEITGIGAHYTWIEQGGVQYWYENGERQGAVLGEDGTPDLSYRGKEIYATDLDAWCWLDNVDYGKRAVSKDVYQESLAGDWGEIDNGDGTRSGKWVRYDSEGRMIKGWSAGYGETARQISSPDEANGEAVYYFDETYGTMAKGTVTIDGVEYTFDETYGTLIK